MSSIANWSKDNEYWTSAWDSGGRKLCAIFCIESGGPATLKLDGIEEYYQNKDMAIKAAEKHFSSTEGNKMKDMLADVKGFIHDNRNILYWLALAFLVDHFFLGGTFRQRLNALVEKMIGRVEKQIEAKA